MINYIILGVLVVTFIGNLLADKIRKAETHAMNERMNVLSERLTTQRESLTSLHVRLGSMETLLVDDLKVKLLETEPPKDKP